MIAYYKYIEDGYIVSVQTLNNASSEGNITEEEYNEILGIIRNAPSAPEGYVYRLREDLAWELCELPPAPEPEEEEVTMDEVGEALEGIL